MATVTFGIKTAPQHVSYEEILPIWKEADAEPAFDHAWLFDHYAPIFSDVEGDCLEGWTLLAALAAQTERIRVGLMVTGNTYRHPAVLTSIAATTDIIANGRLDFGIGAGWNVYEHESMGLELYKPGERIRRLDEACQIYKLLCTQPITDFDGRYYQLKEARREPKPIQKPYPPIMIGGSGEKLTLRVVAKHADAWNFFADTPEEYLRKAGILAEHCDVVGRDPAEIAHSMQVSIEYDNLDAARERTQTFVDSGVTHFVYTIRPPYPDDIVAGIANEVIRKVNV